MDNPERAGDILNQLKENGIRLSLDDFGTGYSSLSYLHRFPLDTLKIDRLFIGSIGTDGRDAPLVGTINELAHSLGMDVVAEGDRDRPAVGSSAQAGLRIWSGLPVLSAATGGRDRKAARPITAVVRAAPRPRWL